MQPSATMTMAMAILVAAGAYPLRAQDQLFASTEPLALTLEADFSLLEDDREEDAPERPATLTVRTGDGTEVRLDAEVRTRGNFRRSRANCFMPPLRLDVKTRQVEGTVFEGQDKLKIVGNCRPGRESWEVLVLREYLAYETLRALTDEAFRVRLARITYVDTSGSDDPRTEYAFFIEDDETLAARLGASVFELAEGRNLPATAFEVRSATRLAVFAYMIGNTDWSEVAGHNVVLLERGAGGAVAVPYDFDFSGLVDAPYATPAPDLGLRSVRERRYLGWCRPPGIAEAVVADFRAARDSVTAVVEDFAPLDEGERRSILDYLAPFFETIETPEAAGQAFLRLCRNLPVTREPGRSPGTGGR